MTSFNPNCLPLKAHLQAQSMGGLRHQHMNLVMVVGGDTVQSITAAITFPQQIISHPLTLPFWAGE